MPLTSTGLHEVIFADRQRIGLAVDLPGAGEHHLDARVEPAARLEDRQLASAVDLQIRVRIRHAVDVAHLAREVEDDLAVPHEMIHRAFLADVRDVDAHPVGDAGDVEEIGARIRDERVHQEDIGAQLDEPHGDVAADEAEAAGDHHPAPAVILEVRLRHSARGLCSTVSVLSSAARCVRLTTSANQSFSTSTPVRYTRGKLKNCDRPYARW